MLVTSYFSKKKSLAFSFFFGDRQVETAPMLVLEGTLVLVYRSRLMIVEPQLIGLKNETNEYLIIEYGLMFIDILDGEKIGRLFKIGSLLQIFIYYAHDIYI